MKKIVVISILTSTIVLGTEETLLDSIEITEKPNAQIVKKVSQEQIKNADLAEVLTKNVSSISIVRRSGIANDIILRGQKKDNINVLIDDAKIYGACPNRMDPPTSHILSNNVESIEVIEGPYDVEDFGTLSGKVKIKTKEPKKGFGGEVNLGLGSFQYKKVSTTVNAGNDKIKVLISASLEESNPYEDGNGNDFLAQQIQNAVPTTNQYKDNDLKAYIKKTILGKAIYNIDDSSEIKLSYTANRSDDVLYPNTPMDADYDDSNIYTVDYIKRDLGSFSKELHINYYYSDVDHPMSVRKRNNSTMMKNMTNHLKSSIWGAKIKNSINIKDSLFTYGVDTSVRNWKGRMYNQDLSTNYVSLSSTDTTNKAGFLKFEKSFGKLDLEFGARYDDTSIDTKNNNKTNRDYNSLNGNIFGIYNADKNTKYFLGIGKASRVPDARELYYANSNNDLEDTKNYEVDLGFEKNIGNLNLKTKLFYSKLKDYIYNTGTFENIDAKIYGIDISGIYALNDEFYIDYGLTYQRGKKDGAFEDDDLAEIPPLKANLSLNYENNDSKFKAELIAVDKWNKYDSSADEQRLSGYSVLNLKYNNQLNKHFDLTLGVDNLFDKTYTTTNTYQDIRYIGTGKTQLINEPGRYFYTNLRYSF